MAEESLIGNIWSQRELGLDLSELNAFGSVTHKDVAYICNYIYPFLQVVNTDAKSENVKPAEFVTTQHSWTIHDYGEAMSVSALHTYEHSDGDVIDDDDEGGDEGGSSGAVGQQVDAVNEIAKLIREKGWASVEMIAGTEMMQRFLWLESKKYDFKLNGYTATHEDEKRYERLTRRARAMGLEWEVPKGQSVRSYRDMSMT